MARVKGSISIDTNDIVGQVFGTYKVIRYVGCKRSKPNGRQIHGNVVHQYDVQCTTCGRVHVSSRSSILHQYNFGKKCRVCNMMEIVKQNGSGAKEKMVESWRMKNDPNNNNLTTGVKRYSISRCKGRKDYMHRVECVVDYKRYIIKMRREDTMDPLPEYISVAGELNNVLEGGKEKFLEWYHSNYGEVPRNDKNAYE